MESLSAAIDNFLKLDYGDGYGGGSGNGYGFGYGGGSGDGYGYGFGCGGSSGDGYGFGCGGGSGDGYGDGIKSLNGQQIHDVDDVETVITIVLGNYAKGFVLSGDLSLKPCFVAKCNNLFAHGETLRGAQEALQNKLFEDMPEEERIEAFWNEFKRGVKYPANKYFDWHSRLTGSCEMGRKEFAKNHGIDLDKNELTTEEFIGLTENSYGGEIIKKLKEKE